MNSLREERAHRLADEVGRRDARDPEPVRGLGRDRRLARAGRAADEQDDRQVELLELAVAAQPPDRLRALAPRRAPRPRAPATRSSSTLARRGRSVLLDPLRQLVRAPERDADGDQRARHQALRVGELRRRRAAAAPSGAAGSRGALQQARASARSRSSSPAATTSFSAKTSSAPALGAASATTSIAAALISTR